MNNLINEITSVYKNKRYEPKNQWSENRFKRQIINSVLIAVSVIVLITAVLVISGIYSVISGIL